MSEKRPSEPVKKTTRRMLGFILYVALLLAVFLRGFVPRWLKFRRCSCSLSDTERQLGLAKMQNSLAAAAFDAQREDYEAARVAASDFFTALRTETDKGSDSALSQGKVVGLLPLLARRDEIITLLARGDASSADLLADAYVSFRRLVNL
jgi:hypothetical protein